MHVSIHRFAARRDANESEIVQVARAFGAFWVPTGPLDGWICYRGDWFPVELKTAQGRYTAAQKRFLAECLYRRARVFTWRCAKDVFETLGAQ